MGKSAKKTPQTNWGLVLLALCFGLGILLGGSYPAHAQSGIAVKNVRVGHDFGEQIRFRAEVNSSDPIKDVFVLFRDVREQNTRVQAMTQDGDDFFYIYDAGQNVLPPFATLTIEFQVLLENGEMFTSKRYVYTYSDDRFVWQTRAAEHFRVHWNQGDETFGQAALDAARNGFVRIQDFVPVTLDEPVDIYVYASPADLQNALFMGGENWVAGHADPAMRIVFVSIAPGTQEKVLMQQQIPHELAHVMLYRYLGAGYENLPSWLQEGIASLAELYPNADYALALERAQSQGRLIPLEQLCVPFSRDASQAFLSYAESVSFTRYLRETYGATKMDALINTYADGVSCERGAQDVYGQSLQYLDARWQEAELDANLYGVALRESAPYLLILAVFLAYPLAQFLMGRRERKNAVGDNQ